MNISCVLHTRHRHLFATKSEEELKMHELSSSKIWLPHTRAELMMHIFIIKTHCHLLSEYNTYSTLLSFLCFTCLLMRSLTRFHAAHSNTHTPNIFSHGMNLIQNDDIMEVSSSLVRFLIVAFTFQNASIEMGNL